MIIFNKCIFRSQNDVLTDYVYNARGELKSITHTKSGYLYKLQYIRDEVGNPLQAAYSNSQFTQPYTNTSKVRYTYDAMGRLTHQGFDSEKHGHEGSTLS